ncbi:MAG: PAS domain-containing protein, partial [Anaerolineales bacterium]|nr:PAS domain-containing protein [Anaerolineales bacterium]
AVRGQPVAELVGMPVVYLHSSQSDQEKLQRALTQVLASGQSVSYESDEVDEGQHTWAVNRLGPIDRGGTITALILISTDITEQKAAEMAMLHTQKLESLGVMAGGIAHDFNNLLGAMVGQVSLALAKIEKDRSGSQKHLQNVLLAGQRATDLTRQMLNYAGRSTPDFQQLDLNRLLQENVQFFSAS